MLSRDRTVVWQHLRHKDRVHWVDIHLALARWLPHGPVDLNNGDAIAQLLAPGADIKLVDFASPGEGFQNGAALSNIAQEAQQTPEGQARLALALAFLNAPAEVTGQPTPEMRDAPAYQAIGARSRRAAPVA